MISEFKVFLCRCFVLVKGTVPVKLPGVLLLGIAFWLCFVCGGLWALASYKNVPGPGAKPPAHWPLQSHISPAAGKPTLIIFAHPHCPCTRASIGELASIMAHVQGRLDAYVLFLKPEGLPGDWAWTDLWRSAAAIPGVTPILDNDRYEARLFQATTSGQTVLYDHQGELIFSGGITASRGHFGDNAGKSAIIALMYTKFPNLKETDVFGCPLFESSECRVSIDELNSR